MYTWLRGYRKLPSNIEWVGQTDFRILSSEKSFVCFVCSLDNTWTTRSRCPARVPRDAVPLRGWRHQGRLGPLRDFGSPRFLVQKWIIRKGWNVFHLEMYYQCFLVLWYYIIRILRFTCVCFFHDPTDPNTFVGRGHDRHTAATSRPSLPNFEVIRRLATVFFGRSLDIYIFIYITTELFVMILEFEYQSIS